MTTPISGDHPAQRQPAALSRHAAPAGVVAGAVLRSARSSSGLSRRLLAGAADVNEATLGSWEDGSEPLAFVPAPLVQRLEMALRAAGAESRLVAELAVAAWCDLVIFAMTDAEDPSCLLADPLAADPAFCELLTWSVTGQPPARYRAYTAPGQLLPTANRVLIAKTTVVIHAISAGTRPASPGRER